MKIVFLGDTHFGCRNSNKHLEKYFEKFYSEIFFPYLLKNEIKYVFQLGDIFDSRKYSNHNSLFEARRFFFSKFDEYNIKLITLLGNHDIAFKESLNVNSSDLFLSQFKNIEIINKPVSLSDLNISIIPWICSENYDDCVNFIKQDSNEICIGHFEIEGFKMYENSIVSTHGLSQKLFSNYEKVLSGHYHHASKKNNIQYIGTPYEMTWQDYNDPKGFWIFNTENKKFNFIKNPFIIHYKFEYDDKECDINSLLLNEELLNNFEEKYIKIQVKNKTNPYMFDMFLEKIENKNPIDIIIQEEIIELESDNIIDETDDTLTITYKYIDSIEQTDFDKNKLKNIMTELYSEALNIE